LHGILTDREIVTKCIARGGDPVAVTAGELAQGKPITVDAQDDVTDVLVTMTAHQIRRVPVVENHRLVGMISEADIARSLPDETVGGFVEAICAL